MTKKKRAVSHSGKLAAKSVAFVGKFGYGGRDLETMLALVAAEGGSVADGMKTAADYLIVGDGVGGKPPAAAAKVQKKHPQTQLLNQAGFYQLINPTAEEIRELIKTGPQGYEFWNQMQDRLWRAGQMLDLSETDFRNRTVEGTFYKVCLDGSDFRGARISAYFDQIQGAKFDGATFENGSFTNAQNCSLKQVTMSDVRWNPATFAHCDFSGANLHIQTGSYTTANGCSFQKADLHEADLDQSKFIDCDFRGANLQRAKLEACEFTGSNLSKADLTRADLRKAKFTNADLRKAVFKEAMLTGADFTGAQIDGADFTGANVTDANLTGLDPSVAKNLVPKMGRTPGPNLRELGKTARAAKKFKMSIEFALGPDESVTLSPSFQNYGSQGYASAWYCHHTPNNNLTTNINAPTFEFAVLNLSEMWSRGTPRFDTLTVDAQKCPLRGKELRELACAAWYEACGLPVPSADEFAELQKQAATETISLREAMLAELHGGPLGIRKWNKRSENERKKLGNVRKHDFSGANLAGAYLNSQDFEGSSFLGANLKKTVVCETHLKGANFTEADMSGANLAASKPADVSFERAKLIECNLRAASFRRCNFKNADLTRSDFSFSDICGADFTGAILTGVDYLRTKFDDKTILPQGYIPPDELEWKGVGPRPGSAVLPSPPKSGTLDFEGFFEQLKNKVDLARWQKARSMLKAERFQLFADVKTDALAGIVKSQADKDLVYSCRLAADGAFGCCTQNLRPCGGLRGALCKHLLVLIIGLAKAGELDSATVDHWIDLSRSLQPAIDEDAMSATFLRYKGAEAGEVDWRPTETIPEDFYSM